MSNDHCKIVRINSLVKISFPQGKKMLIRIFDKPIDKTPKEFRISKETALAKAILGKCEGETIEYDVEGIQNKVKIVQITHY